MSAARYFALAAACRLAGVANVARAAPRRFLESNGTQAYTFLHDGHCAGGWFPRSNTMQPSLDACSQQCLANRGCGFFAYESAPRRGETCSLYAKDGGCPDDRTYLTFDAYKVHREWTLLSDSGFCGIGGGITEASVVQLFGTIESTTETLEECFRLASSDTRCGPYVWSNAPEGSNGLLTCSCLWAGTSCYVQSPSPFGDRLYTLDPRAYTFQRHGRCAEGWIQPNRVQDSLLACSGECLADRRCGFFASDIKGQTCALYSRAAGCPDDRRFLRYNAYKIHRDWVLHASSKFCSVAAHNRIAFGAGKTLVECQDQVFNDLRCGEFAISNAPQSSDGTGTVCQCVREGYECDPASSGQGSNVYTWA